jgi:hypothetical protein
MAPSQSKQIHGPDDASNNAAPLQLTAVEGTVLVEVIDSYLHTRASIAYVCIVIGVHVLATGLLALKSI